MTGKRLTKGSVDALEPRERAYIEWCASLPGFGCKVQPTGHKSFLAQYRVGGRTSRTQRVTIGSHGKLTVEQARVEASRVLARAELGQDVAAERAARRAQMTVAELCREYLKEGCGAKKASTLALDVRRIENHIVPLLGSKRINEVSGSDIERAMRDIAKGKTAHDPLPTGKKRGVSKVVGGEAQATRTVRLLGGLFTYAVRQGYLKENPRTGVATLKERKSERFLSGDELQRLATALDEAETLGLPWTIRQDGKAKHLPKNAANEREVISASAVAAIRLLMLTGCRVREILSLRWVEVDLGTGTLNLPDSKTGAKRVMLSGAAVAILEALPRTGLYVFPGADTEHPRTDLKRPWSRIRTAAGLGDVRLHDLRHSFASHAAMSGMGLVVVGKLLGHKSPATTARYAHFADDPLRRAANEAAGRITAAMKGQSNG